MLHLKGNLLPAKQGKIFTALWSPANDSVDAREMEIVCSSLSQPLDLGTGSIMDGVCTSQQAGNFADCEKVKSNPGEQQLSMCSDPRDREIPAISQKMQHWRFTFFPWLGICQWCSHKFCGIWEENICLFKVIFGYDQPKTMEWARDALSGGWRHLENPICSWAVALLQLLRAFAWILVRL